MKKLLLILALAATTLSVSAKEPFSGALNTDDITGVCNAVTYWQIANQDNVRHHPLDWTNGALYRGVVEWGKMRGNKLFFDFLMNIGKDNTWNCWHRTYHADDICVGQAFIELSKIYDNPDIMRPTMERAFWVASHPSKSPLLKTDPIGKDERWSWSDALFMAPPVYAALYTMTGEKVYLDYMMAEYKECTDSLYDKKECLYYRDVKRIPEREANGAKQFWGRGNGWVFGGLPLIIQNLPENAPERKYFIGLMKEMAPAILKCQDKKGSWHSSLLDPDSYPMPENSASAFFCYGFAWGINNGILDKSKYGPALEKGWAALVSAVAESGKLGYIQPVGAAPKAAGMDATDVYGVGAFLLTGSELYKMYGGTPVGYKPEPTPKPVSR